MHHAARLRSAIEFRDFFPFDFMRASLPAPLSRGDERSSLLAITEFRGTL